MNPIATQESALDCLMKPRRTSTRSESEERTVLDLDLRFVSMINQQSLYSSLRVFCAFLMFPPCRGVGG